jgi:hypothetical protein
MGLSTLYDLDLLSIFRITTGRVDWRTRKVTRAVVLACMVFWHRPVFWRYRPRTFRDYSIDITSLGKKFFDGGKLLILHEVFTVFKPPRFCTVTNKKPTLIFLIVGKSKATRMEDGLVHKPQKTIINPVHRNTVGVIIKVFFDQMITVGAQLAQDDSRIKARAINTYFFQVCCNNFFGGKFTHVFILSLGEL